jgi:23S rRNA (pseudouridine1915-N3)-methyltransferase
VKVTLLVVGRPDRLLREAVEEYERRAARYWSFEAIEVKEERAHRNTPAERTREAESARLAERVPPGTELIALTRTGDAWSSSRLARHLQQLAVHGAPGATFVIGGALGLSDQLLKTADRRMRLSTLTLTHEIARLVLAEQLYRAGTIARGEPYHRGEG